MVSLPEFLSRLAGVVQRGPGYMAKCPAHDDQRQSLSVKAGAQHPIILKCHAGCPVPTILTAMNLTLADISAPRRPRGRPPGSGHQRPPREPETPRQIVAEYDYRDAAGELRYQTVRYEPKDFRQRRPDPDRPGEWLWNLDGTERILYRLDELAALRPSHVVVPEGEKDCDALWDLGIPSTTNVGGAGKWRREYVQQLRDVGVQEVSVPPDNDEPGQAHASQVIGSWREAHGIARLVTLDGLNEKEDVSDFLARFGAEALRAAIEAARLATPLTAVHAVFKKWFGPHYDLQVIDIVLAAAAAHYLDGDPCWVMVVSGSGAAKTETIMPLVGIGGLVLNDLTNTSALLSASPRRDRAADATGGFLRQVGDSGLLIVQDMSNVLSLHHTVRGELFSAFRQIYDGRWSRITGSEGGRRLDWAGRVTMVAASTTAWDRSHEAIGAMGDRFLIVRFDSHSAVGRQSAFDQSQANNGQEPQMRRELAQVVTRALGDVDRTRIVPLPQEDLKHLFELANLTTKIRTAVDRDYREEVLQANDPEMPTRFGKQLGQLVRGGMALGLTREAALGLAIRAAKDSMPPIKWRVLYDVYQYPNTLVADVRRRLELVHNTAKRTLEALMVLRLVMANEEGGEMRYSVRSEMIPGISAVDRNSDEPWRAW